MGGQLSVEMVWLTFSIFFTVVFNGCGLFFLILLILLIGFIVQYTLFCQFCPLLCSFNGQLWRNRWGLGVSSLCFVSSRYSIFLYFLLSFTASFPKGCHLFLVSNYPPRCKARLPPLVLQVFNLLPCLQCSEVSVFWHLMLDFLLLRVTSSVLCLSSSLYSILFSWKIAALSEILMEL